MTCTADMEGLFWEETLVQPLFSLTWESAKLAYSMGVSTCHTDHADASLCRE